VEIKHRDASLRTKMRQETLDLTWSLRQDVCFVVESEIRDVSNLTECNIFTEVKTFYTVTSLNFYIGRTGCIFFVFLENPF